MALICQNQVMRMNRAVVGIVLLMCVIAMGIEDGGAVSVSVEKDIKVAPGNSYTLPVTVAHDGNAKKVLLVPSFSDTNLTVTPNSSRITLSTGETAEPGFTFHMPQEKGIIPVTIRAHTANTTVSEQTVFRISSTISQLRDLIQYYEDLVSSLKQRMPQEEIVDIEQRIDTAKTLYSDGEYDAVEEELERIRQEVNALENVISQKNASQVGSQNGNRSSEDTTSLFSPWLLIGGIVGIIVIVAGILIGRAVVSTASSDATPSDSLSEAKSSMKQREDSQKTSQLDTLIADVSKRIDSLAQHSVPTDELERELALVQRKRDNGLYRMAQQYVAELEQKVKDQETQLNREVNAGG